MWDQRADTVIVLDFETTGLSPGNGDRAIEIGAVIIENGKITDRFQELMNPGFRINSFIEDYTGISNNMLKNAPPCSEVMHKFSDFIGSYNLVAHNSGFDQRFLDAELNRIQRSYSGKFACSMLISRRIYQDAPNHRLKSLVDYNRIPHDGVFHRALADAEMTAQLWLHILNNIRNKYEVDDLPFHLLQQVAKQPKRAVHDFLLRKSSFA